MKKNHISLNVSMALLAVALVATMAGCDLFFGGGVKTSDAGPSMTAYEKFVPASQNDLSLAASTGWVSGDTLIAKTTAGFDPSAFARRGVDVIGSFDLNGYTYYHLRVEKEPVKKAASLSRLKGLVYVEHELVSKIPENETGPSPESDVPAGKGLNEIAAVLDDPETWGRYGHFEITHALDAYEEYGFGGNEVYVADIDTGINWEHEDFRKEDGQTIVVRARSAFTSADGVSFDWVGDGGSFVDVTPEENWDEDGHGTHTAGTMAALGNNGVGVAGVAWKNVKLISYKCFSEDADSGSGYDWSIYGGLKDLVEWKNSESIAQTIPVNMSMGGKYAGSFELEMINYALDNGIVIVASMGNDGTKRVKYPAAYKGIIAVGATRANGEKVGFSTSGNHISVSAPGYCIYSTSRWGEASYEDMSGTSMATPFVTGLVAYMLTFEPDLTVDQIKTILEETATDMGEEGWDADTGYGMVDVAAAVKRVHDGDIPAPGSTYVTSVAQINVVNNNDSYDSGMGNPHAVGGMPVYLYDDDGNFVSMGMTNYTDGSVQFRLLRPGAYVARATWQGSSQSKSASFSIAEGADEEATLEFDMMILSIQTLYNVAMDPGYASGADTEISLYSDTGTRLAGPYDWGYLDTLEMAAEPGKSYVVGIEPWEYSEDSKGEYGLIVSGTIYGEVSTTNGRGGGADDSFEENDDFASARPIDLDTEYGLYLDDADYFSFTVPAVL